MQKVQKFSFNLENLTITVGIFVEKVLEYEDIIMICQKIRLFWDNNTLKSLNSLNIAEKIMEEFNFASCEIKYKDDIIANVVCYRLDKNVATNNLEQAAKDLVNKLDEICNSSSHNNVFNVAHIRGCDYNGPTFEKELENLKKILNDVE